MTFKIVIYRALSNRKLKFKGPPGLKIYFFPRALNLSEIFTEYVPDLG